MRHSLKGRKDVLFMIYRDMVYCKKCRKSYHWSGNDGICPKCGSDEWEEDC